MADQEKSLNKGRKWRWILGLSLGLNLVFVGLFAGAALRFSGGERQMEKPRMSVQGYAAPYVRALPNDARRALGRQLRAEEGGRGNGRAARRQAYQQMVEALRAAPFDIVKVEALLSAQAQRASGAINTAQSLWLEQVAQMSPAERSAYVDRLIAILAKRGTRKSKPTRD